MIQREGHGLQLACGPWGETFDELLTSARDAQAAGARSLWTAEFHISDDTGQTVEATRGDLFYFPEGSTITFSTPEFGLGYFVGQRGEGEA